MGLSQFSPTNSNQYSICSAEAYLHIDQPIMCFTGAGLNVAVDTKVPKCRGQM